MLNIFKEFKTSTMWGLRYSTLNAPKKKSGPPNGLKPKFLRYVDYVDIVTAWDSHAHNPTKKWEFSIN